MRRSSSAPPLEERPRRRSVAMSEDGRIVTRRATASARATASVDLLMRRGEGRRHDAEFPPKFEYYEF
jgi:hypothetical protein